MCYTLPGPRCSPHAKRKLDNLRARRDKKYDQLVTIAKDRAVVRKDIKTNPETLRELENFFSGTSEVETESPV